MRVPLAMVLTPPWIRPALDIDFTVGLPAMFAFTRADAGWYFNSSGLLVQAAVDTPRFTHTLGGAKLGLLLEGSRTNLALHCRDMTNAAWTKTTCTAAKDQTGIDGSANSASSLTATSANGMCKQNVTQSGGNKCFSFYAKRITGSGTVELTLDDGTTWAPISLTGSWAHFFGVQSLTNPTFGWRLATSGDAIAVDASMMEHNVVLPSSPILTTTASVTRGADAVSVAASADWYSASEFTALAQFSLPYVGGASPHISVCLDDGTINTSMRMGIDSSQLGLVFLNNASTTQVNVTGPAVIGGAITKVATRMRPNDFHVAFSGQATRDASGTLPTFTTLRLGSRSDGTQNLYGTLQKLRLYTRGLSDKQVEALVA